MAPERLAADHPLRADLREVVAMARSPRQAGESKEQNLAAPSHFYGRLVVIAVRLLKDNYALPDDSWRGLLICDDVLDTLQLMVSLADTLDEVTAKWAVSSHDF